MYIDIEYQPVMFLKTEGLLVWIIIDLKEEEEIETGRKRGDDFERDVEKGE